MTHVPDVVKSTYQPWEPASQEAVKAVRELATTKQFWEDLVTYYGEENHESTVVQDNIATVKSICKFTASRKIGKFIGYVLL